MSGHGIIAIDGELRVGGVQETITVTGETPVVDTQSTKREVTLDNETMRALPSVRSYSYLLTTVPGAADERQQRQRGPVFAIFPIHGGRGVESRLTVDGMNISNPPGGNQPPNYVADIGNAQEVTMTTSGGLGESETAGLTINIVPQSGGNNLSGLAFVVRVLRRGCSRAITRRAAGARRHSAERRSPVSTTSTSPWAVRSSATSSGTT